LSRRKETKKAYWKAKPTMMQCFTPQKKKNLTTKESRIVQFCLTVSVLTFTWKWHNNWLDYSFYFRSWLSPCLFSTMLRQLTTTRRMRYLGTKNGHLVIWVTHQSNAYKLHFRLVNSQHTAHTAKSQAFWTSGQSLLVVWGLRRRSPEGLRVYRARPSPWVTSQMNTRSHLKPTPSIKTTCGPQASLQVVMVTIATYSFSTLVSIPKKIWPLVTLQCKSSQWQEC
jgi:hypothetical protein